MAEPDYYEVLGVGRDAPREEIKASYRRAVRLHHPDAAPPHLKEEAHARIQLINAAWTALGNPSSRAAYDEKVRRAHPRGQGEQATVNAQTETREEGHSPGRGDQKRRRVQAVMGGGSAPRASNPRTKLLSMVFEAARLHDVEGRPEEAARICQQVLRADPTSAEAAVLLADIYASQGQRAAALDLLERALRLQPSNALYRSKWEALRHASSHASHPATSSAAPTARATSPIPWAKSSPPAPLASRLSQKSQKAAQETGQGPGDALSSVEARPQPPRPSSGPEPDEPQESGQESGEENGEGVGRASMLERLRSKLWR